MELPQHHPALEMIQRAAQRNLPLRMTYIRTPPFEALCLSFLTDHTIMSHKQHMSLVCHRVREQTCCKRLAK